MADYHWPPTDKCSLIGRRISRLDGPWKSSGRIKYSYDVNRPNMLHGKMVFSPYAHAKVVSIDTSAAEKMPGVKAVEIMTEPGKDRKSTRLNSSHGYISYAVFCLKKKKKKYVELPNSKDLMTIILLHHILSSIPMLYSTCTSTL